MSTRAIKKIKTYDKTIDCMPDKSMSVRAVLFNAYAEGRAEIRNLMLGDDVRSAVSCARGLGAEVNIDGNRAYITGNKFHGASLDCGNSGTTARLLMGLLAGIEGSFGITGDKSLCSRPMLRVIEPLRKMGADIAHTFGKLPALIVGSPTYLHGIDYVMPVASAQVKSAILLAGLNADGVTTVRENVRSRDHSENMLEFMGADVTRGDGYVSVKRSRLKATDFTVPGDISSAAYPLCLALMTDGRCTVRNVGINETRTGLLDVLGRMGATVVYRNERGGAEPVADVSVEGGNILCPFEIEGDIVPRLIDEIPALCALACFVKGDSVVRGASELRVKETDRITATADALNALGADIEPTADGMIIHGGKKLAFGTVDPKLDHRIAMIAAIAGAAGEGAQILDSECVSVSYPNFYGEVIG